MSGEVDQKQLMKYIELEKEIHAMETKDPNVLKIYKERENLVKDVEETLKTMETKLKELEKNTKKELKDVEDLEKQSLSDLFKDNNDFNKQMNREKEEYIEARSKEDMMRQEVEGLKKQRAELQEKANEVKGPGEKLSKLYEERDNLLSDIFGGEYGSQRENELEAQYDMLMDKKERVSLAEYKWTNGLTLLNHAVSQMHHGCQKWMECKDCNHMQQRYTMATEVRNNLVAAVQNVNSTQRYLHTIDFPYCKPGEMETLTRAANNIYTDMQDPQRHQHAYQCYNITWKRAHALQQWFVNVINNTIKTDLKKVSNEAHKVEQQLRAERIKLIREKIEASGGKAPELNVGALKGLADGFSHFDQMQLKDEDKDLSGIGVTHPEPVGSGRQLPDAQRPQPDTCPSTPLPLSELAPTPCEDDLFGDISELKEQYKKHTEEFMKAQDLNKARMEQGLQAKLQARRHKKRS